MEAMRAREYTSMPASSRRLWPLWKAFFNHDANAADFCADLLSQRDDAERRFAAGQKIINQQNVVVRI